MLKLRSPLWVAVWAATSQLVTAIAHDQASITVAPRATAVINAVIPTTAGQIGVNPVEDDIGDPNIYRGTIQHLTKSQSSLLTVESGSTKWLAKHIDYLTETTSAGTTSTVQLSVATAAAAAGSVVAGDVTVVLAEGLADKLAQAAGAAVKACGAVNSKRALAPDDVLSCLLSKGADAYADNGLFSIVNPAEWEAIAIDAAQNAVPLVKGAFQVAKTQARKAMLALFMSAVSINISASEAAGGAVIVGAIVLPKLGFGVPTETENDGKCPSGDKKTETSPICSDKDCLGDERTERCTVDPNKNCPCLLEIKVDVQPIDSSFFDYQLPNIHSILSMPDPSPPKTIQNADPVTVNAPTPSPTCGSNKKSSPSVNFDMKIPSGKNGIVVNLPIANQPGSWRVSFDKTNPISFYQIDAGKTKFVPITNGNSIPSNGKIEWTVPDGNPTENTKLTLNFKQSNIDLKVTVAGEQTCTPSSNTGSTGTPNTSQCISDCGTIVTQLQNTFGDTIDVTSNSDISKFVDYATGTGNKADNDWWRISSHGNCFLMIGKDATHRGFPDYPAPVKRQDLINFVNQRKAYACTNAHPMLVATPPTYFSSTIGSGQICLTDYENYQKCTGHVAPPS